MGEIVFSIVICDCRRDMGMAVISWEVSDKLWSKVEPLLPSGTRREGQCYSRAVGGGRKAGDKRKIFSAMFYILRTGIQWLALPREKFGYSGSTIHKYFRQWLEDGFFVRLWQAGLAEYDELEGIAWEWQSADGAMMKAPLAQESVGRNPTDRGKKREQAEFTSRRAWRPAINYRIRS
jgi:transposase